MSRSERYHEGAQLLEHPKFNLHDELPSGWQKEAAKLLLSLQLNEAQCELKVRRQPSRPSKPSARSPRVQPSRPSNTLRQIALARGELAHAFAY